MIWNERKIIVDLKKLLPKETTITSDNFDTEYETKKIIIEPDSVENAIIFFGVSNYAFENKLISEIDVPVFLISDRESRDHGVFNPEKCDPDIKNVYEVVLNYLSKHSIKQINGFEELFDVN